MIVKMQKLTLLCMDSARDTTLTKLQELGVVHLTHIREPRGDELEQAKANMEHVKRALDSIPRHPHGTPSGRSAEDVVADIMTFLEEKKKLSEKLDLLRTEEQRIHLFGSFQPEQIRQLAEQGVHVKLYTVEGKQPVPEVENATVQVLGTSKDQTAFAVISREPAELDVREVKLPERPLSEIQQEIAATETALEENTTRLESHANDHAIVEQAYEDAVDRLQFVEAHTGMGEAEQPVAYLQGYCPRDDVEAVKAAGRDEGWAVLAAEPAPDEDVPTLIRNPKWVELINPVMSFVGIVPGYKEVDISRLFLIFFSLFFGMIVGDAGYGAIFLAASIWMLMSPKVPRVMGAMMTVMSIMTIAWGALTGNYFGISAEHIPAPLAGYELISNGNPQSQYYIMLLCFLIGTVHLTLAHGWNVIRKFPSLQAVGDLGWIMTTWVMFFAARNMILLENYPAFTGALLIVGAVLIVLSIVFPLSRFKKDFFNLITLPLDLVSNFVDVVSYIRLFAVGMATFAVANAFNQMAMDIGFDSIIAGVGAALIIFFGHVLNIALAIMGVLVHGIRLNTLEFSGHLGMEWSGYAYQPFARNTKKSQQPE